MVRVLESLYDEPARLVGPIEMDFWTGMEHDWHLLFIFVIRVFLLTVGQYLSAFTISVGLMGVSVCVCVCVCV